MFRWSILSAVNNEEVLRSCLLASPGIEAAYEVIVQRGALSAATAYNDAILKAKQDIVVIVHQDMYLPEEWPGALRKALTALSETDPNWGVLGVWGVPKDGEEAGHVYCTAGVRMLGGAFEGVTQVRVLDEVVLIIRKSSGLRFDPAMPGFHLYGTDICLEAERRGMKCYATAAFCIHNSNSYKCLPWVYWRCYLMLRRKWCRALPVRTLGPSITHSCWPLLQCNLAQLRNIALGRYRAGRRVSNPGRLYHQTVLSRKAG
jgi:hypothetical protein